MSGPVRLIFDTRPLLEGRGPQNFSPRHHIFPPGEKTAPGTHDSPTPLVVGGRDSSQGCLIRGKIFGGPWARFYLKAGGIFSPKGKFCPRGPLYKRFPGWGIPGKGVLDPTCLKLREIYLSE